PGDGHIVYLPLPDDIELNFALLMRNLNGNTTRNPHQGSFCLTRFHTAGLTCTPHTLGMRIACKHVMKDAFGRPCYL
ncbi:MAG: hypothetical protein ACRC9W_00005, partial [Plesiomonas sp.]